MEDKYKKVSADFYDKLETLVITQKTCEIVFLNNGSISVIRGKIADLFDKEGEQFIKLDSGLEIELDKLKQVDGNTSSGFLA